MLEASRIKEFLYDPDGDGTLYWLIQVGCRGVINTIAGGIHMSRDERRWTIQLCGRKYLRSHLVFALYNNRWPKQGLVLDHIDRNTINDGINNIREITQKENMANRPVWGWVQCV